MTRSGQRLQDRLTSGPPSVRPTAERKQQTCTSGSAFQETPEAQPEYTSKKGSSTRDPTLRTEKQQARLTNEQNCRPRNGSTPDTFPQPVATLGMVLFFSRAATSDGISSKIHLRTEDTALLESDRAFQEHPEEQPEHLSAGRSRIASRAARFQIKNPTQSDKRLTWPSKLTRKQSETEKWVAARDPRGGHGTERRRNTPPTLVHRLFEQPEALLVIHGAAPTAARQRLDFCIRSQSRRIVAPLFRLSFFWKCPTSIFSACTPFLVTGTRTKMCTLHKLFSNTPYA